MVHCGFLGFRRVQLEIAEYVRVNRKRLGITQSDLASKLGVARTTLVAIERGQRKLRASELTALRAMGFPDESIETTETPHSNEFDERWMWLSRGERVLISAY